MSRKDFIKRSAIAATGLVLSPGIASAVVPSGEIKTPGNGKLGFKNVRLETGFEYDANGEVIGTKTGLFCIETEKGQITGILPNNPGLEAIDAGGYLMLPSFKDMHIHLDKTYYGDKWQAVRKRSGGIKGMIALEQQILPDMLKNSTYKAEKIIALLQSKGTSFARSHVNIEPTSKLQSLRNLQLALENRKDTFGAELVAFPQHGVFYTDTVPYLKEAARAGIDFIGSLDPFNVDGNIEKTVDFTVQLALDYDKGIDIHLHESGESGLKTIEHLVAKVNENPVLKGKTYLSHCFALGKMEEPKLEEIALKLADAEIGIVSTIPFGSIVMPIPALLKHKVRVMAGNDSIVDHWNTFGTGSVLEKANLAAQLYGFSTELQLSRMLGLATANVLPLTDNGVQQWPQKGDKADFVFVDATCSAEAVARISPVMSLVYNSNIVF